MVLVNEMMDEEVSQENYKCLRLLVPSYYQELWGTVFKNSKLKLKTARASAWPSYDPSRIVDNEITIIQVI